MTERHKLLIFSFLAALVLPAYLIVRAEMNTEEEPKILPPPSIAIEADDPKWAASHAIFVVKVGDCLYVCNGRGGIAHYEQCPCKSAPLREAERGFEKGSNEGQGLRPGI